MRKVGQLGLGLEIELDGQKKPSNAPFATKSPRDLHIKIIGRLTHLEQSSGFSILPHRSFSHRGDCVPCFSALSVSTPFGCMPASERLRCQNKNDTHWGGSVGDGVIDASLNICLPE